ncbi:anhydro-N-acetylmuramic acid kinase [Ectothiorhodospiraceae bacterium BW-2]|nr:anhydro-N-acetylmuramic acid kinase [Ectothiorhodospiraceae bacterium BW-2]
MTQSLYIGVMSGTSVDGIDLALTRFEPRFALLATHHTPFGPELRQRLEQLIQQPKIALTELGQTDALLGESYADAVTALLQQTQLSPSDIAAIGLHGQTIAHYPQAPYPFTLQLGDPNRVATRCGITVVADLRRRDIALGGEGAPLVPAFHQYLWHHPQRHRAVLNLGGIANLTLLPPAESAGTITGFDTGPANTLLDQWYRRHHPESPYHYDHNGHWGNQGRLIPELLQRLCQEPYFQRTPPKSCGRELFNLDWLLPQWQQEAAVDVQRTLYQLTVESVATAVERHAPDCQEVIVCGGGAANPLLRQQLTERLSCPVQSSDHYGLDPQWIEASAFAWLACQRVHGRAGNLPSVTGAREAAPLGAIYC